MTAWKRLLAAAFALLLLTACAAPAATPTALPAPAPTMAPAAAPTAPAPPTRPISPAAAAAPTTAPPAAAATTRPIPPAAAAAPTTAPAAAPTRIVADVPAASGEIIVYAASSLTDAFDEIGAAFKQANPSVTITFSFGASSQLRTQLEQGARADVFASADQAQMDSARKAGAIAGSERPFARNRLVLITPRDNPARIAAVKDIGNDGLKLVTAQLSVPIGQYTSALLDKAAADPAYGPDFPQQVESNIVSREDNVRQIVSKVQLGEADAGIVYSTDVTPQVRDQLQQIAIPDRLQTIATYFIAVAIGNNAAGGEAFTQFVLDRGGQAVLGKWGFLTLTASPPAAAVLPAE